MSKVYYIAKGFYGTREGAYGLLRVYGTDDFGFRATIVKHLEGFHSQTDARTVVKAWLQRCAKANVRPFSHEGIGMCSEARKQMTRATPVKKAA